MKPETEKNLVSIVIPAYKAEDFIVKTLQRVKGTLDQIRYPYEIICVVDGKTDKTFEKASKFASSYPKKVRVIGYKQNMGKGNAVRFGMARANGDIIGFVDAGVEINPNGISMLLEHFEWYDADVVVGSKRHAASKIYYPWYSKIMSFGYQMMAGLLFGLKVKDTQVGMKFFRREVVEKILPRLLVKAFAFDIEMLSVANYLGYKKIYEAPVELKMRFSNASTIISKGFLKIVFSVFVDTLAVFYRLHILHYYDYKNRKNWIVPIYDENN